MKEEPRTGTLKHHDLAASDRERVLVRVAKSLAAEGAVLFAYVFGSFVEDRAFGDVDVAVFLDPERCPDAGMLPLQLDLACRLEAAAGLPIDAVLLNDAPLGLRMAALRGRVVHSRDEARRLAFVEATCLQAMDMACLLRESLRDLLGSRAPGRAQ
ncbi:MAG: nucleotidyltransferase domain-containing protein [bacterium]|nr:nucleotidyltransferase domain-containing protein [bacterium]